MIFIEPCPWKYFRFRENVWSFRIKIWSFKRCRNQGQGSLNYYVRCGARNFKWKIHNNLFELQSFTVACPAIQTVIDWCIYKYFLKAFTLKSDAIKAVILNYGGVIQSLETPDKNGVWDDITTGFETIDEYPQKSQFFGCLGRFSL